MRSFFILSLWLLVSCGEKSTSIEYGKTTVADLIKQKGEVQLEEKIPLKEGKILHFGPEEKYQALGNTVTVGFKSPKGDERTLLYWKRHFRNCATVTRKVSAEESELACPALGLNVIYTEGSEFISRIIEYEKQ